MRIAQIASEAAPFAKTGGLGDVASALTRALAKAGHDARLFVPLYKSLRPSGQRFTPVSFLTDVPLAMGGRALRFTVFTAPLPDGGPPVYFVGCPALYDRAGIYAQDGDEHLRFGFLTR